jgi:hypothetical protein
MILQVVGLGLARNITAGQLYGEYSKREFCAIGLCHYIAEDHNARCH